MQRLAGPTGIPRLIAERDGNGHADRFWALALAVSAAGGGSPAIDLIQTGGPREILHLGLDPVEPPVTAIGWGTVPSGLPSW